LNIQIFLMTLRTDFIREVRDPPTTPTAATEQLTSVFSPLEIVSRKALSGGLAGLSLSR